MYIERKSIASEKINEFHTIVLMNFQMNYTLHQPRSPFHLSPRSGDHRLERVDQGLVMVGRTERGLEGMVVRSLSSSKFRVAVVVEDKYGGNSGGGDRERRGLGD